MSRSPWLGDSFLCEEVSCVRSLCCRYRAGCVQILPTQACRMPFWQRPFRLEQDSDGIQAVCQCPHKLLFPLMTERQLRGSLTIRNESAILCRIHHVFIDRYNSFSLSVIHQGQVKAKYFKSSFEVMHIADRKGITPPLQHHSPPKRKSSILWNVLTYQKLFHCFNIEFQPFCFQGYFHKDMVFIA